jgi:DNA-directed RNA polymerase I, II, and III subunit RPABC2
MSDFEYVSDHESDFSDFSDTDDVDTWAGKLGGAKDDFDSAEQLVAPADPDEGAEDDSDIEYDESEAEEVREGELEGEEEEYEEDELDLKKVSDYNKEIIVVKPENRRTSHIMSKFEMTEAVSIRATQISQHNNCLVDIAGLDDPIKMAQRELAARRCPLIIRRHVGDVYNKEKGIILSYYEFWSPNEMMHAKTYNDVL